MSEVQQSDSGSSKGKHGKVRAKKNSTHIDMTPMVDLAFLLLTFFMLTTTFGKPKTMEINMPVKDPTNKPQEVNNAITMLLTGDDKAFWYFGELKPETKLTPTNFSSDGIRKLLLDYNKFAVEQIKDLRAQALTNKMADTTLKRLEVDIKGNKRSLMVLVKTDDKAKYKNVIDMLDELNICMVGKYALVDLGQQEYDLIKAAGGGL
jgi:biopolymer transport protein ExbD